MDYCSSKGVDQKSELVSTIPAGRVAGLLGVSAHIVPFSTCLSKFLVGSVLLRLLGYKLYYIMGARESGWACEVHHG